jgi:hypothetical protein
MHQSKRAEEVGGGRDDFTRNLHRPLDKHYGQ